MTSHSTIINFNTPSKRKYDRAKLARRKKRAKQCIGCKSNVEGYCSDMKNWCFNAQPSCLRCVQQPIERPIIKKQLSQCKKKTSKKKV